MVSFDARAHNARDGGDEKLLTDSSNVSTVDCPEIRREPFICPPHHGVPSQTFSVLADGMKGTVVSHSLDRLLSSLYADAYRFPLKPIGCKRVVAWGPSPL
ncbi:MAG: hypothetical protein QOF56_3900 [Acidobacteriaceae bacterium]|nr:hypothetical protein [Acidobacteriaceae bacterium]